MLLLVMMKWSYICLQMLYSVGFATGEGGHRGEWILQQSRPRIFVCQNVPWNTPKGSFSCAESKFKGG